jgi:N-methylhydantoinase B
VDSGGFLRSMACVIANVEHIEAQFPLLYLYRRQEPDTGGAGRRRGGVGVSYAVVPHGVERIDTVSPHFSGTLEPESLGLAGGYPGATNAAALASGSTVRTSMAAGRLPSRPDELGVDPVALPAVAAIPLEADDVLIVRATGGGGFGDPLERRPEDVLQDVLAGLLTPPSAEQVYGVVIDASAADGSAVDPAATLDRRAAIRRQRRQVIATTAAFASATIRGPARGDPQPPDGWSIDATPTGRLVRCLGCGHTEPLSDDTAPLIGYPSVFKALDSAGGEATAGSPGSPFGLVERYCPACARLLDVDRIRIKEIAPDD